MLVDYLVTLKSLIESIVGDSIQVRCARVLSLLFFWGVHHSLRFNEVLLVRGYRPNVDHPCKFLCITSLLYVMPFASIWIQCSHPIFFCLLCFLPIFCYVSRLSTLWDAAQDEMLPEASLKCKKGSPSAGFLRTINFVIISYLLVCAESILKFAADEKYGSVCCHLCKALVLTPMNVKFYTLFFERRIQIQDILMASF